MNFVVVKETCIEKAGNLTIYNSVATTCRKQIKVVRAVPACRGRCKWTALFLFEWQRSFKLKDHFLKARQLATYTGCFITAVVPSIWAGISADESFWKMALKD